MKPVLRLRKYWGMIHFRRGTARDSSASTKASASRSLPAAAPTSRMKRTLLGSPKGSSVSTRRAPVRWARRRAAARP